MNNYLDQIESILSFANRSQNTIKAYKTYTAPFFEYCVHSLGKDPAQATPSDIRTFLLKLADERKLSDASINHAISEIRFFYEAVLGAEWNAAQVPHRHAKNVLPYVPSREEVRIFLSSIEDLKKKAMVCLMYSAGLRVGEVCRLKCSDIQHSKGRIHVAPSKNSRDRYAVLSENMYRLLCDYWRALPDGMKTRDWLFTQQHCIGKHIYPQFIQDFIPKQEARLGLPHRLTPHSFRHAYATHSYMSGMRIEDLSLLLGHASTDNTRIYIHLAQMGAGIRRHKSPMEGMEV